MICRPGGRDDVPFRSVARRLVRAGRPDGRAGAGGAAPADVRPAGRGTAGRQGGGPAVPRRAFRRARRVPRRRPQLAADGGRGDGGESGRSGSALRRAAARAARVPGVRGARRHGDEPAAGGRADAGPAAGGDRGAGAGAQRLPLRLRRGCPTEPGPRGGAAQTTDVHATDPGVRVAGRGGGRRGGGRAWWRCATTSTSSPRPSSSADLYAHLLAGQPLGAAATRPRKALAANPTAADRLRAPVALQDWARARRSTRRCR